MQDQSITPDRRGQPGEKAVVLMRVVWSWCEDQRRLADIGDVFERVLDVVPVRGQTSVGQVQHGERCAGKETRQRVFRLLTSAPRCQ